MVDTSTEAVTKLLDGVTPGPWITVKSDVYPEGECDSWVTIGKQDFDAVALIVNEHIKDDPELKANARFITAARDLVPALLAERDALKKERDEAMEGWHVIHPNITVQDVAKMPEIKALIAALKPFADIGVSENPDFHPIIRMDRDAIIAARSALRAIADGRA